MILVGFLEGLLGPHWLPSPRQGQSGARRPIQGKPIEAETARWAQSSVMAMVGTWTTLGASVSGPSGSERGGAGSG